MNQKLNSILLKSISILLLTLTFWSVEAKEIPKKTNQLVNDFTGQMLSQAQFSALERKLRIYNDTTSTQIAIVLENSLEGDDLFEYTYRIADGWGIGQEGKDNGLLIYAALDDRKMGIHVGPGLQGNIPDAVAKRIINNVLRPAFRQGNYYGGLNRATDIMIQLASGEFQNDGSQSGDFPWEILVLIAAVLIILYINRNDGGGYYRGGRYDYDQPGRRRSHRRGGGGWIIFPGGGGSGGGGFGDFGGGGGFGGFGGGGFDGGGAFGDW